MHEPSDGIAEELKRQLQLRLAAAAIAVRRAITARRHALEDAVAFAAGIPPLLIRPMYWWHASWCEDVEASRACYDPAAAGRVVENPWSETTEVRYG